MPDHAHVMHKSIMVAMIDDANLEAFLIDALNAWNHHHPETTVGQVLMALESVKERTTERTLRFRS